MKNLNKTIHNAENKELIASELRYRRLFESAKEGILLIDFNTGMIIDVNQFLIDLLGYSKDDFLKKHFWEIGVFKNIVASRNNFLTLQKKEYVRFDGLPLETKTGKKIEVEFIANAYQADGATIIQCNIRDITEHKQIMKDLENARVAARNVAEDLQIEKERLARAKAKDEAILASIADGCITTNENGEIILINQMAQKMLGYTSKESIGKPWYEILHREDENGNPISSEKGAIRATLSTTISEERKKRAVSKTTPVYYYVRKNKTRFPVAITIAPVILESKIIGAIEVFRDISKEKEIEKLRMDFLSLASHQLRTPLSGTKWLIETIQRGVIGELNPRQKEYLGNIYQINERMIRLVSDMLNVLMLESGVVTIKKQEVSISKIYKELLLIMEPVSQNKRVMLCNILKNHKLFFLKTDLQILRSILECFVSNAINYSQGGQKVILDVKKESGAVVFFVRDFGIGIPKQEQKRIFERFYRASNAKVLKPTGTGLGLNIAKMLAEKIDAKISFESQENKGSTFYLRIPKSRARMQNEESKLKI